MAHVACRDLTRPSPRVIGHFRGIVSTDIQGSDLRVASSDRDISCKAVASFLHPKTAADLHDGERCGQQPPPSQRVLFPDNAHKADLLSNTVCLLFASNDHNHGRLR